MPELAAERGTVVDPSSLSRWLIRNGYRFKKRCWPASRTGRTSQPPLRTRRVHKGGCPSADQAASSEA